MVNINSFTKHRAIALVYIVTPLLWALLSALYPLSANLTLNRRIWGQLAGGSLLALAAHLAIFATLFGTYALGLRRTQRPVWIWLSFGVSAIILLFSFPGESLDIFDYIFRGRMMVEYGASPLTATPYDFRNMPFHRYVTWSQWVDAYGPIWEYVSAAISWVAKQGASAEERAVVINQICATQPAVCTLLTRYVTGYRLMAIALTAICALLIARIAPAETRATALYAFLLNPLTLLTSAVGGHNEALMLVFVLLWVLCFTRRQFALGLLALAAAAHVKFTALLLAPVALLWMLGVCGWRKTLMIVLPVAAIALALSYAAYWPLGGWATLPKNFEQRALLSTNSFGELINLFLFYGLGWEKFAARAPVARVAGVAFALMAGPLLLHWLRRPSADIQDNLRRALGLSMLYLLVGSYWFQPWYALWPLALTACLPGTQWRGREYATLTLTVVAPLAAVLGDYARAQTGVLLLAPWLISSMVVALIFVPTLTSAARAIWPARFRGPQQA